MAAAQQRRTERSPPQRALFKCVIRGRVRCGSKKDKRKKAMEKDKDERSGDGGALTVEIMTDRD